MNGPTSRSWRTHLCLAGVAAIVALGSMAVLPAPAQARVWVAGPCCGWYGPGPWWGGYYPAPYYYAPPPAAYYPPPPAAYPPGPGPAPTAYTPPATGITAPAAAVTYTNKPAFRNAQGQTCREYMTHNGGQAVYGTACQAADGQWRVVN